MRHPMTSMVYDSWMETLDETLKDGTEDEQYLAEVLKSIFEQLRDHPAIVHIMNSYALRAMERGDQ